MKKSILVILCCFLLFSAAHAEMSMGVQVILPDTAEGGQPVSLDDLKLNEAAEIDGWGTITLTSCRFLDALHQYKQGKHTVQGNWDRFNSGSEADYLIIQADILNSTKSERDYLSNVEVKAIFDDDVEYIGWYWQYNWDNETKNYEWNELNGIQNKEFVITKADQFAIGPYYAGHYCFGCTLPNAVVNGKQPLRLEIKIDGNEITYHVRK